MKKIVILGSTGTIGINTLKIISENQNDFNVFGLAANKNYKSMFRQIIKFKPKYAVMVNKRSSILLSSLIKENNIKCNVLSGSESLDYLVTKPECDLIVAAIVGAAGLSSTFSAANHGKKILLANKESLVMAGGLLLSVIKKKKSILLPIDSEHNAIFQCLPPNRNKKKNLKKIILTASGGPFLNFSLKNLKNVSPKDACNHPNWKMGRKISVDSATLMNKGLELIEAHYLFGIKEKDIEVIIHPESIVHSLVEFKDGSVIAQLSNPDMKIPISYCLGYPKRIKLNVEFLDLIKQKKLTFYKPNNNVFPSIKYARQIIVEGGASPIVFNASNEVAVDSFLKSKISFLQIFDVIESMLSNNTFANPKNLEDILEIDNLVRIKSSKYIKEKIYN